MPAVKSSRSKRSAGRKGLRRPPRLPHLRQIGLHKAEARHVLVKKGTTHHCDLRALGNKLMRDGPTDSVCTADHGDAPARASILLQRASLPAQILAP
jgi:hypothetical protein